MKTRLQIIRAEQGPPTTQTGWGGPAPLSQHHYKLVADRPFKKLSGKGDVAYTPNTLTLEGILTGSAWTIDVSSRWSTDSLHELWLRGAAGTEAPPTPADLVEILNERIDQTPPPHVRVDEAGPACPGMLYAHRERAIGPLAVGVVCDLPAIQSGAILPTGSRATIPEHQLYSEHSLAAFVVRPQFAMAEAAAAVRDSLQF